MKKIEEYTIKEAKNKLNEYKELQRIFNLTDNANNIQADKEINHGYCINVLDKGFMYIGELITDGKFLTINNPQNIRKYTSGKGLLWHAANGGADMVLDKYIGKIKAPYTELKHFIPTNKELWL